jgi:murein L,D-transpeptidase YafK
VKTRRYLQILFIAATLIITSLAPGSAEAKRGDRWLLRNNRVKGAYKSKRALLKSAYAKQGLTYPTARTFIRILKKERVLELWAAAAKGPYKQIKTYPICAASGVAGPKRQQGDAQVPEGFYRIQVFNPWSSYHLSMGINYPNRSDRILGVKGRLGSAIMLHGACASIGCVAITDDKIEEVYLAAAESYIRKGRKPVYVHIFPTRLDAAGMAYLSKRFAKQPRLLSFWSSLRPGYQHFDKHHTLPRIKVDRRGKYVVITPKPVVASLGR